ncbi:hypothetical protein BBI11_13430 [Planococcus maritimus]|uniref:hypothetical protein n=1 Tax=Planococcus maritimus TaxID=192421 RepID=UPI00080F06FC|nr:hypothetical protein [Planococcus maritimus]ANU17974.1 hypothetical protein BBI11_13430 [Planococcus maritimus]
MSVWILVALSVLLGGIAIQHIYMAIKPVKDGEKQELGEVFSHGEGPFFILALLFTFLAWCSEKFFPKRCQLAAFRLISLLMAVSLIALIFLMWNLDIVADFLKSL